MSDPHDAPVSEQERLLQQYLDGTLSPDKAAAFEGRAANTPALSAELESLGSLFAALDGAPTPSLAAEVSERWRTTALAWPAFFGGLAPAALAFAVLDLILVATLALVVTVSPLESFRGAMQGLKTAVVWLAIHSPTVEQLTLAAVALLVATAVSVIAAVRTTAALGRPRP